MQELGTVWVTGTVLWRYIRDNEFENTINHQLIRKTVLRKYTMYKHDCSIVFGLRKLL